MSINANRMRRQENIRESGAVLILGHPYRPGHGYRGDITNWKTLDGPDLDIRLVSRNAGSGTRDTFQRRILKGFEPGASSTDCRRKDDASARVFRCESESTEQVLNT
ncbi:substrate-binding domain-containing protein, partial [Streptomyces sp. NPDC050428]|uniref:substrate-binding domain-containing protein n=1 Tax=Streptomyces sp. NPDC050428 TaxID=3155757 RepID=UPI00342360CF